MTTLTLRSLAAGALAGLSAPTWAHDGHGLTGGHWHATDSWGFIAFVAVLAAAIWFSRAGKP